MVLRKDKVVCRSSIKAKFRALAFTITEIIWIQKLIIELHIVLSQSPGVLCDNISANFLAKNPVFHSRIKHIDINVHFIREMVMASLFNKAYTPS